MFEVRRRAARVSALSRQLDLWAGRQRIAASQVPTSLSLLLLLLLKVVVQPAVTIINLIEGLCSDMTPSPPPPPPSPSPARSNGPRGGQTNENGTGAAVKR